jgi:uncharacterized protein YaaN involved in tellurite resistance
MNDLEKTSAPAAYPAHINTEEESAQLNDRVSVLEKEVTASDGSPLLEMKLKQIGSDATRRATKIRTLVETKVKDLMVNVDGESPTANKLIELRTVMDRLNPHSLHNDWKFKMAPEFLKKKLLRAYAEKFESNQDHVTAILGGLQEGKERLLERIIDLSSQYQQLKEAGNSVQEDIYIGEALYKRLETYDANPGDPIETQKLERAKNAVARRIRDLRVAEQAITQFLISINRTADNSNILSEAIDSALFVGPLVLSNAVAIQVALSEQKNIANALDQFQSGLGTMMEQNAGMIEEQTKQIGELYNNPVIALEHLEKSYDKLMNAVTHANEVMNASTTSARELSSQLETMSRELQPVVTAQEEAHEEIKKLQNSQA